jgi:hypothetical protein
MRCIAIFLVTALLVGDAFAQREIDPDFGEGGHVALGFDAIEGDADDFGLAACPHPSGSLVVSGLASGGQRVVTAWLTAEGELDKTFSGDGKESFPLVRPPNMYARYGLCHPSGRIYLVYEIADDTDEGNLRVIAVDPDTGLPVPGFGVGGVALIDLDAVVNGLGKVEQPAQLAAGPDGSVLVVGDYDLSDGSRHAYALRIGPTGALLASHLTHREGRAMRSFGAISPAADGTLWTVGTEPGAGAMSVLRLRPDTLAFVDVLQGSIGDGLAPRAARHVDGSHLLIAAARGGVPMLASVWASGWSIATVPFATDTVARASIVPLGASRHIVAWQTNRPNDWSMLFGRAIVDSSGRVALDSSFGVAGVDRFALEAPNCVRLPSLIRMTLWNGHPTVAGRVGSSCAANSDRDYLVVRLNRNFVFADGME